MNKEKMMEKKVHWLQTPEGRARMSRIQKARYRKLRAETEITRMDISKGETVVRKIVLKKKKSEPSREEQYQRIAEIAVANGETENLMRALSYSVFRIMLIRGGVK